MFYFHFKKLKTITAWLVLFCSIGAILPAHADVDTLMPLRDEGQSELTQSLNRIVGARLANLDLDQNTGHKLSAIERGLLKRNLNYFDALNEISSILNAYSETRSKIHLGSVPVAYQGEKNPTFIDPPSPLFKSKVKVSLDQIRKISKSGERIPRLELYLRALHLGYRVYSGLGHDFKKMKRETRKYYYQAALGFLEVFKEELGETKDRFSEKIFEPTSVAADLIEALRHLSAFEEENDATDYLNRAEEVYLQKEENGERSVQLATAGANVYLELARREIRRMEQYPDDQAGQSFEALRIPQLLRRGSDALAYILESYMKYSKESQNDKENQNGFSMKQVPRALALKSALLQLESKRHGILTKNTANGTDHHRVMELHNAVLSLQFSIKALNASQERLSVSSDRMSVDAESHGHTSSFYKSALAKLESLLRRSYTGVDEKYHHQAKTSFQMLTELGMGDKADALKHRRDAIISKARQQLDELNSVRKSMDEFFGNSIMNFNLEGTRNDFPEDIVKMINDLMAFELKGKVFSLTFENWMKRREIDFYDIVILRAFRVVEKQAKVKGKTVGIKNVIAQIQKDRPEIADEEVRKRFDEGKYRFLGVVIDGEIWAGEKDSEEESENKANDAVSKKDVYTRADIFGKRNGVFSRKEDGGYLEQDKKRLDLLGKRLEYIRSWLSDAAAVSFEIKIERILKKYSAFQAKAASLKELDNEWNASQRKGDTEAYTKKTKSLLADLKTLRAKKHRRDAGYILQYHILESQITKQEKQIRDLIDKAQQKIKLHIAEFEENMQVLPFEIFKLSINDLTERSNNLSAEFKSIGEDGYNSKERFDEIMEGVSDIYKIKRFNRVSLWSVKAIMEEIVALRAKNWELLVEHAGPEARTRIESGLNSVENEIEMALREKNVSEVQSRFDRINQRMAILREELSKLNKVVEIKVNNRGAGREFMEAFRPAFGRLRQSYEHISLAAEVFSRAVEIAKENASQSTELLSVHLGKEQAISAYYDDIVKKDEQYSEWRKESLSWADLQFKHKKHTAVALELKKIMPLFRFFKEWCMDLLVEMEFENDNRDTKEKLAQELNKLEKRMDDFIAWLEDRERVAFGIMEITDLLTGFDESVRLIINKANSIIKWRRDQAKKELKDEMNEYLISYRPAFRDHVRDSDEKRIESKFSSFDRKPIIYESMFHLPESLDILFFIREEGFNFIKIFYIPTSLHSYFYPEFFERLNNYGIFGRVPYRALYQAFVHSSFYYLTHLFKKEESEFHLADDLYERSVRRIVEEMNAMERSEGNAISHAPQETMDAINRVIVNYDPENSIRPLNEAPKSSLDSISPLAHTLGGARMAILKNDKAVIVRFNPRQRPQIPVSIFSRMEDKQSKYTALFSV